ncbi:hypothetical protein RvY_03769 [Ramazzottius varieornatus]|uniref:Uncharacterized protein n=1 Tax=Ramazzottius varieornatus TaxID=947166 RepID=A0A1D1UYL2_RAMVA|nr:hypothetical protein RvY_03769 [Ramazzottius varieornatus]
MQKLTGKAIIPKDIANVRTKTDIEVDGMKKESVQLQPYGSYLCGPLVCSIMAEVVQNRNPSGLLFVKGPEQREWLASAIETERTRRATNAVAEDRKTSGR